MNFLAIINGPMGVGKTTVCRELLRSMDRCVWLDGDWCWMQNPWIVNDETTRIAEDNMLYVLRNHVGSTTWKYVLFSWIFRSDDLVRHFTSKLVDIPHTSAVFTLLCSEEELKARRKAQLPDADDETIAYTMDTLSKCASVEATKIETTALSPAQVAARIREHLLQRAR